MAVSKLKQGIRLLLSSFIIAILFGFISWITSKAFDKQFTDVLFFMSLGVIMIGFFIMMKGNPSGVSLSGLGQKNAQYIANETLEAVRSQQESTDYHKNFKKHSVVELSFKGIALVLGGGLLIILNTVLT